MEVDTSVSLPLSEGKYLTPWPPGSLLGSWPALGPRPAQKGDEDSSSSSVVVSSLWCLLDVVFLPGKYWVWVGWAWVGPLYCSWVREGVS